MGSPLVQKIDVSDDCLDACKNYTCPNKGRCKNHFIVPKCDCVGTGFYGKECQKGKIPFKVDSFFIFYFLYEIKCTQFTLNEVFQFEVFSSPIVSPIPTECGDLKGQQKVNLLDHM